VLPSLPQKDEARMYQHEVKDEFLREIGHIAVSFSLLEEILRFLVIA
jgi:hypothetical protein